MQTKTETIIVPEHSYEKTTYIAEDGEEFIWEHMCIEYEKQLRIQNKKINQTLINKLNSTQDCYEFRRGCPAQFYYLSSVEDFHDLQEIKQCTFNLPQDKEEDYEYTVAKNPYRHYSDNYCDFYKYGPGWYIFYVLDDSVDLDDLDDDNGYYCLNWNHYINKLENKLKNYKEITEKVLAVVSKKILQQKEE